MKLTSMPSVHLNQVQISNVLSISSILYDDKSTCRKQVGGGRGKVEVYSFSLPQKTHDSRANKIKIGLLEARISRIGNSNPWILRRVMNFLAISRIEPIPDRSHQLISWVGHCHDIPFHGQCPVRLSEKVFL